MMGNGRLKSADLDTILRAVGKPTGDEIRARERAEKEAREKAALDALPVPISRKRWRNVQRLIAKAQRGEE
jgi:hypothetical protein